MVHDKKIARNLRHDFLTKKIIDKGRLNDLEVKQLADELGLHIHIYEYDLLPKHLPIGNYIILLGKVNGHWMGLHVLKHTAAHYDSFGVPPPEEVVKAIGRRILFFSTPEEQTLNSNHCAQYCLRFLYSLTERLNISNAKLLQRLEGKRHA